MNALVARAIVCAVIFAAGAGIGYMKAVMKYERAFDKQVSAAKDKEIEHERQVLHVAESYSGMLGDISNARLRGAAPASTLRGNPAAVKEVDGAKQESSDACEGTEFYWNALEDVAKIEHLQLYISTVCLR